MEVNLQLPVCNVLVYVGCRGTAVAVVWADGRGIPNTLPWNFSFADVLEKNVEKQMLGEDTPLRMKTY